MNGEIGAVEGYGAIDESDLDFGSAARAGHQWSEVH
jgi:hypothetical protein